MSQLELEYHDLLSLFELLGIQPAPLLWAVTPKWC